MEISISNIFLKKNNKFEIEISIPKFEKKIPKIIIIKIEFLFQNFCLNFLSQNFYDAPFWDNIFSILLSILNIS